MAGQRLTDWLAGWLAVGLESKFASMAPGTRSRRGLAIYMKQSKQPQLHSTGTRCTRPAVAHAARTRSWPRKGAPMLRRSLRSTRASRKKAYDARISTGPPILSSLPAPLGTTRGSRRRAFRAGAEAEFMDGRPRQGGPRTWGGKPMCHCTHLREKSKRNERLRHCDGDAGGCFLDDSGCNK